MEPEVQELPELLLERKDLEGTFRLRADKNWYKVYVTGEVIWLSASFCEVELANEVKELRKQIVEWEDRCGDCMEDSFEREA